MDCPVEIGRMREVLTWVNDRPVSAVQYLRVPSGKRRMSVSEEFRTRARELTEQARATDSNSEKTHLALMARSFLLQAKNADWVASTDKFLDAIKKGQRWPHPAGPA